MRSKKSKFSLSNRGSPSRGSHEHKASSKSKLRVRAGEEVDLSLIELSKSLDINGEALQRISKERRESELSGLNLLIDMRRTMNG